MTSARGVAKHFHHLVMVRLALAVGEHEAAFVGVVGHVFGDAVENLAHANRRSGLGHVLAKNGGAVRLGEDRFGNIAADLAAVDVPGGDNLEVLGPVAAEIPVGEPDLLVGAAV